MNEFENQVTPNETPVEPTPVTEPVAPVEPTPVAEPVAPVEPTPVVPVAEPVVPVEQAYMPVMDPALQYTYEPAPQPKKKPIKTIITILIIVLSLVVVGVLGYFIYDAVTNTPEKAVELLEDFANDLSEEGWINNTAKIRNGFAEKETEELFKIIKKSEIYDELEDLEEYLAEGIEDNYGDDFKISIKVTDKDRLDKDDLKDFRDDLRDFADDLDEIIDRAEEDGLDDIADEGFDGNMSKAKKLIRCLEDLRDVYKKAKVTDGYEVEVEATITGDELDEDIENETSFNVYKINGRWVIDTVALSNAFAFNQVG